MGGEIVLPEPTTHMEARNRILFAGTPRAALLQALVLANRNSADHVPMGREATGAWMWEWLRERCQKTGDQGGKG